MSFCPLRERETRYVRKGALIARVLAVLMLAALILSLGRLDAPVWALQEEPSPIHIELIVPEQAGPGTAIEVSIKYDAVDLNAGADLNYNVFGPGAILTRDPEPPNPAYNTWIPTRQTAQGTIKIRLQVHDGSAGQTILHQVEVRWGTKVAKFEARTLVKLLPPTPTATLRPRPQQPAATATPAPTQPAEPERPDIKLREVSLVDLDGQPLSSAETNQEIALEAIYASSNEARDVMVWIRFDPDVVNLDLPREDDQYVQALPVLPSAPEGAPLFAPALKGRIRAHESGAHESGGGAYALQAIVRLVPSGEAADAPAQELVSAPVEVSQVLSLRLSATAEAQIIQAGGSFVVHALVENPGSVPVEQVRLALLGLSEGFVVSPGEQTIDRVAANGGAESKVFTVRSPEEYDGPANPRVVAAMNEVVLESEPLTIRVSAPRPLTLETSASATAVHAGGTVYIDVSATNESEFEASGVAARLIDISGNLGVLVQEVGDIGPGESREWLFVVQVPDDFPIDTAANLVVQTISDDGITSQSSEIELDVSCKPRLEVFVEPPAGRLRGGDSVEAIALVKNVGPCAARDVSVSLVSLPDSFVQPPAQQMIELAPGEARYVTFNVLIPQRHRGDVRLIAQTSTGQGIESQSSPVGMIVGGLSPVVAVLLGLLVLVVAIAGVVGAVLYFRKR